MKKLFLFAAANGLEVAKLTFKAHGHKSTGYALVKERYTKPNAHNFEGYEVVTLEPVNYSNGDRWLVKQSGRGLYYAANITQAIKGIDTRFDKEKANLYVSCKAFLFNPYKEMMIENYRY